MLKLFWKVFKVPPYEDSSVYPDLIKRDGRHLQYCEKNGDTYTFTPDDEVEINGKSIKFPREYELSREIHRIMCIEKSRKRSRRRPF